MRRLSLRGTSRVYITEVSAGIVLPFDHSDYRALDTKAAKSGSSRKSEGADPKKEEAERAKAKAKVKVLRLYGTVAQMTAWHASLVNAISAQTVFIQ